MFAALFSYPVGPVALDLIGMAALVYGALVAVGVPSPWAAGVGTRSPDRHRRAQARPSVRIKHLSITTVPCADCVVYSLSQESLQLQNLRCVGFRVYPELP